jgi:hypothetical protein
MVASGAIHSQKKRKRSSMISHRAEAMPAIHPRERLFLILPKRVGQGY